ncbi:MAG: Fur family transcriptional regulator [SAR324 cluster bacterium]
MILTFSQFGGTYGPDSRRYPDQDLTVQSETHTSLPSMNERLENFPRRCRSAGLKITQQRLAVYAMLAGSDSHPTPEEVFASIRGDLPQLSLATVYKILDQFQRAGFVRKVSTEGQAARYDAKVEPHHHLVCTACGAIQDIQLQTELDLSHGLPADSEFWVARYDVIFHGLCGACRKAEASRSRLRARSGLARGPAPA